MAPEDTWDEGIDESADSTQQVEEDNELSRAHAFVSGDDNSPDEEEEGDDEEEDDDEEEEDGEEEDDEEDEEEDDEDGAEYDPESVTASIPASAAPSAQSKPKVSGGFLVGSSDDEDDERDREPVAIRTAQKSPSPLQEQSNMAVYGDAAGPSQIPSRKRSVSGALKSPPVNMTVRSPQAPPPCETATSALEARVAEDPRGDMDAWLALIAQLRRQESADEIRAVYGRFLDVFPQSVGDPSPPVSFGVSSHKTC